MSVTDLPDCPHCSAANTLTVVWTEMGSRYCECSSCSKQCYVDEKNRAHIVERHVERDVSGPLIDGP